MKDEKIEDTVIKYLEQLASKMRGDTPEEELEDTDLGWMIEHVDHTIGLVEKARKKSGE